MAKQFRRSAALTFADAARNHILEVLEQTGWMIGGRNGAAARLGLPRTTLIYKMRKLGIESRYRHWTQPAPRIDHVSAPRPLQAAARF